MNQALSNLSSVTLRLLNLKSNEQKMSTKIGTNNLLLTNFRLQLQRIDSSIQSLESECVSHFPRYYNLDVFCSGGIGRQIRKIIVI